MSVQRATYGSHVDTRVYFDYLDYGEVEMDLDIIEVCPDTHNMTGWALVNNGEYEIEVDDEVCQMAYDIYMNNLYEENKQ